MADSSQPTRLIVPLTHKDPRDMRRAMPQAIQAGADVVELRLDCLDEPSEDALRELLTDPPCPVIVTCRSQAEGGHFAGGEPQRLELLALATRAGADWVDLELSSGADAIARLAQAGRPLILSSHDFAGRPDDLDSALAAMELSPGAVNKIAFAAAGPEDALAAFDLIRRSQRPCLALAMGEAGVASRILARKFGAFGTFAALEAGAESAPGQPTIAELRDLYRWDQIDADTQVFGVIGCPVGHSMSPAIHNAAFAADGLNAVYVPLRVEPGPKNFNRFIDAVLDRPWAGVSGLSVTIPHKENALARVGPRNVDELSRRIGAINTICFTGAPSEPLTGLNTDYAGALDALVEAMGCQREDLAGRRVAVLGAGGAARAIVAGLAHYGARTVVYNRTIGRAEQLAAEFDSPAGPVSAAGLNALASARAEIWINCTPIGMHPKTDACPLGDDCRFDGGEVVFDTIYNPLRTLLLRRAAQAGCTTVAGLDMFVNQAATQYEAWTARKAPREAMRRVVLDRLAELDGLDGQ